MEKGVLLFEVSLPPVKTKDGAPINSVFPLGELPLDVRLRECDWWWPDNDWTGNECSNQVSIRSGSPC